MSRLTSIKRLAIAALAAAGVVAACRAAQPGEAPPLAPRPEIGRPTDPVPGAPDPLAPKIPGPTGPTFPIPDAATAPITPTNPGPVSEVDSPIYRASAMPMQAPRDGGLDAPPRDAPRDAAATDAPRDATTDGPRDAAPVDAAKSPHDGRVPDARDIILPPVPDASLPGDAARPLR